MTIKEALITELEPLTVSSGKLDKALIAQSLDPSGTYVHADHERGVDLAYAGLLITMIVVSEVKEDDVSLKFTMDSKGIVSWLMRKWGLTDPYLVKGPTVKQVAIW